MALSLQPSLRVWSSNAPTPPRFTSVPRPPSQHAYPASEHSTSHTVDASLHLSYILGRGLVEKRPVYPLHVACPARTQRLACSRRLPRSDLGNGDGEEGQGSTSACPRPALLSEGLLGALLGAHGPLSWQVGFTAALRSRAASLSLLWASPYKASTHHPLSKQQPMNAPASAQG